jgi:Ca-activated chloride channel family protein
MSKSISIVCVLYVVALLGGCSPSNPLPVAGKAADEKPAVSNTVQEPAKSADKEAAPPPQPVPAGVTPPAPSAPALVGAGLEKRAQEVKQSTVAVSAAHQAPARSAELDALRPPSQPTDRENYAQIEENPVKPVAEQPVSTFSIDVDTGSYANVRRFLNSGRLPPRAAVRIEEMINYFDYDYPAPASRQPPFQVSTELASAPWNPKTTLLAIGIKGYQLPQNQLPPANLVFLIDVSGSMNAPDKLELLKPAMKLLIKQLRREDKVAIVVYAGAAGMVLEPTQGSDKAKIEAAIDRLAAGGSTNGGAGIQLAYALARQGFIDQGVNRVILATDGDFNVGTVNFDALKELVETQRKSGIALTALGFGTGNYNDRLLEQLADAGNGNYAYIDTLREANKVLVEQMSATLLTIAKDVKIQIEFNPALVEEYRLIGYENRVLRREDFNNDAVDAGDIGAGHTVTALYEIALKGSGGSLTEPLRYSGTTANPAESARGDEIAFLRLRYKQPDSDASQLQEWPIQRRQLAEKWQATSERFRFAAAVAGFGQLLRGGRHTALFGYDEVLAIARGARGEDPFGYRGEFLTLVSLARSLDAGKAEGGSQAIR